MENLSEVREYVSDLEDKGYKINWEGLTRYVKLPLGQEYSASQLERFARNTKLEFGNMEHIAMMKAHNFLSVYELGLELASEEEMNNFFKEFDRAREVIKRGDLGNEDEILEAYRLIEEFEVEFEEGIYSL